MTERERKVLEAMAALCARSEQCESDLRRKMRSRGVEAEEADAVIDYLYEHRFLDTDRYAGAYVRDKLRHSHWGRIRLRMALAAKRIPAHSAAAALESIDEAEYRGVVALLVERAARTMDLDDAAERRKLTRRLYARGFEPGLTAEIIAEVREA
ncbi:MAG: regulatory protein RecX [Muribaculaceae bacterium]|nr:regulatory protein RecX [Muribaculaceae bacterium]